MYVLCRDGSCCFRFEKHDSWLFFKPLQHCSEVVITKIHDIVTGGDVKKEALLQFFLAPLLTESKEEAVAYLQKAGIDIEESKKQFRELMEKNTGGIVVKKHPAEHKN